MDPLRPLVAGIWGILEGSGFNVVLKERFTFGVYCFM